MANVTDEGGCVSKTVVAAAALRSTLLTEVFPHNQLIPFNGEVVHDYDKSKRFAKLGTL